MSLFKNVEHSYYRKLKRILKNQGILKNYEKIYFLGGFEYDEGIYSNFKKINNGSAEINQFLKKFKYNSQKDNVELFLIESGGLNYLMSVLDSLELLDSEQILDIIHVPKIRPNDFDHELVCSSE